MAVSCINKRTCAGSEALAGLPPTVSSPLLVFTRRRRGREPAVGGRGEGERQVSPAFVLLDSDHGWPTVSFAGGGQH